MSLNSPTLSKVSKMISLSSSFKKGRSRSEHDASPTSVDGIHVGSYSDNDDAKSEPAVISPQSPSSPNRIRSTSLSSKIPGLSMASLKIKRLVSKKKRRFTEDGFDLDLTYVTPRIIAMGYPSSYLEGIYRNHYKDIQSFLRLRHAERYKLYNLCSERKYSPDIFEGRVSHYGFDDHCPPPLELFLPFCKDVDAWLTSHPENIVAIHCKAGKGRTGTMICAYLLYSGRWKTVHGSTSYYGAARSLNHKGVTIPSQQRFIKYFASMCSNKPLDYLSSDSRSNQELSYGPDKCRQLWESKVIGSADESDMPYVASNSIQIPDIVPLCLKQIILSGFYPEAQLESFYLEISCPGHTYSKKIDDIQANSTTNDADGTITVTISLPLPVVWAETKITFKSSAKGNVWALCWIHSSFVEGNEVVLQKTEIDKLFKDCKRGHKKYSENFFLKLSFQSPAEEDNQRYGIEEEKTSAMVAKPQVVHRLQ